MSLAMELPMRHLVLASIVVVLATACARSPRAAPSPPSTPSPSGVDTTPVPRDTGMADTTLRDTTMRDTTTRDTTTRDTTMRDTTRLSRI
jgi:RNA polymerase sigma factor for flagellar operon FliA